MSSGYNSTSSSKRKDNTDRGHPTKQSDAQRAKKRKGNSRREETQN